MHRRSIQRYPSSPVLFDAFQCCSLFSLPFACKLNLLFKRLKNFSLYFLIYTFQIMLSSLYSPIYTLLGSLASRFLYRSRSPKSCLVFSKAPSALLRATAWFRIHHIEIHTEIQRRYQQLPVGCLTRRCFIPFLFSKDSFALTFLLSLSLAFWILFPRLATQTDKLHTHICFKTFVRLPPD